MKEGAELSLWAFVMGTMALGLVFSLDKEINRDNAINLVINIVGLILSTILWWKCFKEIGKTKYGKREWVKE
jgi:hypothetical protein